jgi:putative phosphonate metabolism protein
MSTRYALYFAPDPSGALWRFGSDAIGYDAATGAERPVPAIDGIPPARLADLAREPARYGFHATLKPPIRLVRPADEAAFLAEVAAFAAERPAFAAAPPDVALLGSFLALTLPDRPADLHGLADACVERFDRWRAPMDAAERERRLTARLGAAERANLDRWGYPYVFDAFRFHMTLTGPTEPAEREPLRTALAARYASVRAPLVFDALSVFVQTNGEGRFRLLARYPFAG